MKAIHCAAVDLGATSGRVLVGTWADARLELTEVHRFANQFRPLAGHDYWDIPYLWAEVRAGLIKAKQTFPRLASVGVDSWAVDSVLVDDGGRPVYPVHAYRDKRTLSYSKRLDRDGLAAVYADTGVPNYSYNTSLQLQETVRHTPGIVGTAKRCLFIADYFNFLLSGRMVNEVSIASHSQFLALRAGPGGKVQWSAPAMRRFGVPPDWFSAPAVSPKKLGRVREFPELEGVTSVLVPGHDTACAFAAMPAAPDGSDIYVSSGTWSLVGFESDTPTASPAALRAKVSNERMGDGSFHPLRSCLGLWLLEQTLPAFQTRPENAAAWRRLIDAASAAPRPKRLIDVTDDALLAPKNMRAAIDAQLRSAGARPPQDLIGYVRLICDSLGQGHADSVRLLAKLAGREFKRILIVGGGSKNALLCQATADAARLPVVSYELEGSAVGNLANQLIALGAVKDLATFRRHFAAQLKGIEYQPRTARTQTGRPKHGAR